MPEIPIEDGQKLEGSGKWNPRLPPDAMASTLNGLGESPGSWKNFSSEQMSTATDLFAELAKDAGLAGEQLANDPEVIAALDVLRLKTATAALSFVSKGDEWRAANLGKKLTMAPGMVGDILQVVIGVGVTKAMREEMTEEASRQAAGRHFLKPEQVRELTNKATSEGLIASPKGFVVKLRERIGRPKPPAPKPPMPPPK